MKDLVKINESNVLVKIKKLLGDGEEYGKLNINASKEDLEKIEAVLNSKGIRTLRTPSLKGESLNWFVEN